MKRTEKTKKQYTDALADICKGSDAMLIGLTGGIATGKSTVAGMFRNLGAVIIDFDILARNVVQPGRQSWQLIIDYFGSDILNPDDTINRKKLSGIVFNDPLKREKLETLTHPFIWDEFFIQVETSVRMDRKAIISAVIPLLIEGNMHDLFIKNIVIYLSPEIQIKRLMDRDKISREMADKILKSQMPIDEKLKYADFVIRNEGTIEDTANEVSKLWENLQQIQASLKTGHGPL